MERELLLTGIGGQGVQLAAQVLARAATGEDRHVSMFGVYEGMVRGGSTRSTLVFGDAPIQSPPIVSRSWSALAMHDHGFAEVEEKLAPAAFLLINSDIFAEPGSSEGVTVLEVAATSMAAELGNPMSASMVMAAAYAKATGLVGLGSLVEAMKDSLPAYRSQHVELNTRALEAGYERATLCSPAWSE